MTISLSWVRDVFFPFFMVKKNAQCEIYYLNCLILTMVDGTGLGNQLKYLTCALSPGLYLITKVPFINNDEFLLPSSPSTIITKYVWQSPSYNKKLSLFVHLMFYDPIACWELFFEWSIFSAVKSMTLFQWLISQIIEGAQMFINWCMA